MPRTQLLDPSRTCEPHQALNLQRTSAFLHSLLLQSRTHAILLPWGELQILRIILLTDETLGALVPWLSIGWYSPGMVLFVLVPSIHVEYLLIAGRRAYHLCPRLLPRWHSDPPFWRTDRP